MDIPEHYQSRLAGCIYAVEASSNETSDIWQRFCNPEDVYSYGERHSWEGGSGWLETIGELYNRPICISIMIYEVDGYPVMLWEATSQLVDYAMIDEWFAKHLPHLRNTNATNFHQVIHEIARLQNINIADVEDLKVEGVDSSDYPDFSDAFFSSGIRKSTGLLLSDKELETLTENNGDVLNLLAIQSLL